MIKGIVLYYLSGGFMAILMGATTFGVGYAKGKNMLDKKNNDIIKQSNKDAGWRGLLFGLTIWPYRLGKNMFILNDIIDSYPDR